MSSSQFNNQNLENDFVIINKNSKVFSEIQAEVIRIIDEYLLNTNPKKNIAKKSFTYFGEKLIYSIKNIGNNNDEEGSPKFHTDESRKRVIYLKTKVLKTHANCQLAEVLLKETINFPKSTVVKNVKAILIDILSSLNIAYFPNDLEKVKAEFRLYKSKNISDFDTALLKLPKDIVYGEILSKVSFNDLSGFSLANKIFRKYYSESIKHNVEYFSAVKRDKLYADVENEYKVNINTAKEIETELKDMNEYLEILCPVDSENPIDNSFENQNLINSALRAKQKNLEKLQNACKEKISYIGFFSTYKDSCRDFSSSDENNIIYLKCQEYLYEYSTKMDKTLDNLKKQFQYKDLLLFINPYLEVVRAVTYFNISKIIINCEFLPKNVFDKAARIYVKFLFEKINKSQRDHLSKSSCRVNSFLELVCAKRVHQSIATGLVDELNSYLKSVLGEGAKNCLFGVEDNYKSGYNIVASFKEIHEKLFGLLFADVKYRKMFVSIILKPAIQEENKNNRNVQK